MTLSTQLVLRILLEDPTQEMYGLQICRNAGLPSGTIHPILARLEGCGWLESRWEDIDPVTKGRPRRRYYRLSDRGAECARTELTRVRTPPALVSRLRPHPTGAAL
jgi:PadR family transcriptional regulator, regulatory protein PadR